MPIAASEPSFLETRAGKLTLVLLCAVAFLDFVGASIVNVALPRIRADLAISVQDLQWIPSGYLLTYGGFMLLGGRAADLLGRRRLLLWGTVLFAAASLGAGLAASSGVLIAARLVQGIGAALMLPAALSALTTAFTGADRLKALGAWGAMAGLGSAVGVLAGGTLSGGPGWRWVFFVNLPVCLAIIGATWRLLSDDHHHSPLAGFDLPGAVLVTGGMLLLVFALVRAPLDGWGAPRTLAELAGAAVLLGAFVVNEHRSRNPLLPLSIFRVKGLAAADVTQLVADAAFIAMFFFLTLYMQTVLRYSPIQTGLAYLPVTAGIGVAAGIASQLVARVGTRPVFVAGVRIAGGGVLWLSRVPVHGSYLSDLLPGLVLMSLGLGAEFVAATTAANTGVPADRTGLAAALFNASQQIGGALGLAIFSALATSRTTSLLAHGSAPGQALTGGFGRALLASSLFLFAAAAIALRAPNTHGETTPATSTEPTKPEPDPIAG